MEEYEFPETDYEAYQKYPNLKWVYSRPNLLDAQHTQWTPYASRKNNIAIRPFTIDETSLKLGGAEGQAIIRNKSTPGYMYVNIEDETITNTECIIQRGEIKWMSHFTDEFELVEELCGDIDIRMSAFVTMYFKKFTGIISVKTIEAQIFTVSLRPTPELVSHYPEIATKLLKKIYKK